LHTPKRVVIVGSGTAGVIAAGLIKEHYKDRVDITVVYDKLNESIGVGEGTLPSFSDVLEKLKIPVREFIKNVNATIKLGINFKNWIPETEYFHAFYLKRDTERLRIKLDNNLYTSHANWELGSRFEIKSILGHTPGYGVPSSLLEREQFKSSYGYHMDGVLCSRYIRSCLKDKITFIEDEVISVNSDGENIKNICLKERGNISADYYIDCSGFAKLLFRKLNRIEWKDVTDILPINRAIIQQIKTEEDAEILNYTSSEATTEGWIWQIPVNNNRYGSGYLYCSEFTSDEEARISYNKWLIENHDKTLTSSKIIKFSSGYYVNFCLNNCTAIGLASGFFEPLEATSIASTINQVNFLLKHDIISCNTSCNRKLANEENKKMQQGIIDFLDLHYFTSRTDSNFWKYITNSKADSIQKYKEKCNLDLLNSSILDNKEVFATLESYIAISKGLNLFDKANVRKSLYQYPPTHVFQMKTNADIAERCLQSLKSQEISHKLFLANI
jgi:tryptophan 7-halogenase